MIDLWLTIETLIGTVSKVAAMAAKVVGIVRTAHAEGREPNASELAEVRKIDDDAAADLRRALGIEDNDQPVEHG